MEEDACEAAAVFTNGEELLGVMKLHKEGEKVNMCQALTELIADGRMEGQTEEMLRIIRNMINRQK